MECELCYTNYNEDNAIPKLMKPCAHTYCVSCLSIQKENNGCFSCPKCPNLKPFDSDPSALSTNSALLKLIKFRQNEKIAYDKMKHYEIENPKFFSKIEETVSRSVKPFELHLSEIKRDELIYVE